jgi:hypothetical protein
MGAGPKNLPLDTSVYRQAILQSKSGLGSAGIVTVPSFMLLLQISTFYELRIAFRIHLCIKTFSFLCACVWWFRGPQCYFMQPFMFL